MAFRLAAGVAVLDAAHRFVPQIAGALLWSGALGVHAGGIAPGSTLTRCALITLAAHLAQTPTLSEELVIRSKRFPFRCYLPPLHQFCWFDWALASGTRLPFVPPALEARQGLGLTSAMNDA